MNRNTVRHLESPTRARRSTRLLRRGGPLAGALLASLIVGATLRADPDTALVDYVAAPDPAYEFHQVQATEGPGYTEYHLDMTSLRWQESEVDRGLWEHRLIIVVPDTVEASTALLNVSADANGDTSRIAAFERDWALNTRTVVASLRQVPNQPLVFAEDGVRRWENGILGHSFTKYMDTGDETWPGILPMVKAAVRAMDTIESFVAAETDAPPIESFVVTGASKRGWTAWLCAVVDPRVRAIAPVVFDFLRIDQQAQHQLRVYEGVNQRIVRGYAEALTAYVDTYERLSTPEGQALLQIIDPYAYRERLTLPKFLINAPLDQFSVPDSAGFYFDDLVGSKHLRYVPNADHVTLHQSGAWARGLEMFYLAVIRDEPLPQFGWTIEPDGSIRVETETTPLRVSLWQANNPTHRDFRVETIGRAWASSPLEDQGDGVYIGRLDDPPPGYTGLFVELEFESGGAVPFTFTTEVLVSCVTAAFEVTETSGEAPLTVTFDASRTTSTGGEISSWSWDFGDGETAEGEVVTHTFERPGRFIARLTATDSFGRSDSTRRQVEVGCRSTDVSPWVVADIGDPLFPGGASYETPDPENDELVALRVCAGGRQIGGPADQGLFVHREMAGDFSISARLWDLTDGASGAGVGLMVRASLDPGASFAASLLETRRSLTLLTGRFRLRYRATHGASAGSSAGSESDVARGWVRIDRVGDTVSAWSSFDGSDWTLIGEPQTLPGLPETALVGVVAVGRDREVPTVAFEPIGALVDHLRMGTTRFIRGDCNDDGSIDVSDGICILEWLFLGGAQPGCVAATNANGDPATDIADATYLLNHLFLGGAPLPAPFPECGAPTLPADESLGCAESPRSCP